VDAGQKETEPQPERASGLHGRNHRRDEGVPRIRLFVVILDIADVSRPSWSTSRLSGFKGVHDVRSSLGGRSCTRTRRRLPAIRRSRRVR